MSMIILLRNLIMLLFTGDTLEGIPGLPGPLGGLLLFSSDVFRLEKHFIPNSLSINFSFTTLSLTQPTIGSRLLLQNALYTNCAYVF